MSLAKPTNGSNADYAARIGAVFDLINNGNYPFPAVQVPSADANTLDDYEEGTWTPADASGASLTFTLTSATYTKIGRHCLGQCQFTYPVTANGSNANVSGRPFAALNGGVAPLNTASSVAKIMAMSTGTSTLTPGTGAGGSVTNAQMSAAFVVSTFHHPV